MILADSSVWIEHFRRPLPRLPELIGQGQLAIHPQVIGELALGSVPDRSRLLTFLASLPALAMTSDKAFLAFVEARDMHGKGVGYVDCHLLSACEAASASLWTYDKRLQAQAERLNLASQP